MSKDEKKKVKSKPVKNETKKKVVKENFFKGVISEIKKVRWPNKKEMVKYSVATISFVIFFALYFGLIEVIMYFIETMI